MFVSVLKQIKQAVAAQNCCGSSNIFSGCRKYQRLEPKNCDLVLILPLDEEILP